MNGQKIRKELAEEEGLRLKAYRCTAGFLTIGVGHNCDANPTLPIIGRAITKKGQVITAEESNKLLQYDLDKVVSQLDKNIPWWRKLAFPRQYVMISLCFNLGIDGLMEFKNTLRFIRLGMYSMAGQGLKRSLWYKQVGARGPKLVKIMATGAFAS